jgi:Fe-Mn family superoxide dismutase
MTIQLPLLPYALNALEPVISEETLKHHYLKHHQAYVTKLNTLIAGTPYEKMELEEIIVKSHAVGEKDKSIFNNAGQVWNHTFYWSCMTPGHSEPSPALQKALETSFGSVEAFHQAFSQAGKDLFGSGWVWLVKEKSGNLVIRAKPNAGNPLTDDYTPLLVCDVWEHAYYLDRQENRAKYLEEFKNLIHWRFVEENLTRDPSHALRTNLAGITADLKQAKGH